MFSTALTRNPRSGLARSEWSRDPLWNFVDRFFSDSFPGFETESSDLAPVNRSWMPPVDIYETEEGFVATADLPGLGKKDIDVSLEGNVLTISGERSYEKSGEQGAFRRIERAYGNFRRSFTLPAGVDATKVDAKFKDGVLTLTLPKSETAKARKISVN